MVLWVSQGALQHVALHSPRHQSKDNLRASLHEGNDWKPLGITHISVRAHTEKEVMRIACNIVLVNPANRLPHSIKSGLAPSTHYTNKHTIQ